MFSTLWVRLLSALYFYLRPMLKWILNRVTGKCELLRISYQYTSGAHRTISIEECLLSSRRRELNRLVKDEDTNIEAAVLLVMKTKYIIPEIHTKFEGILRESLTLINGYCRLKTAVESLRKIKYSSDNEDHEQKLMKLWAVLTSGRELSARKTSDWSELGFQGEDPQTDFRGMGQLGLDQLLYFCTRHTSQSRALLSHSHHPKYGYSFAIVGINLTELVYTLLLKGNLRCHFYNLQKKKPTVEDFHEVYCYLFHAFDKFWILSKPKDIMEFGHVREKFRKRMVKQLASYSTTLVPDFTATDEDQAWIS